MIRDFEINRSKELRVLHLISSSGFLGAENVVLELAKESAAAGYWVTIGVIENRRNLNLELAETAKAEGIRVVIFPCKSRFDLRTISGIRDFIHKEQPNLLHSHGYKANFYALCAIRKKIPWIVTNHNWLRTTFNLKLYAHLDRFLIRFATKIIVVSDEIAAEILGNGIPLKKLLVIDNGIDLQRFSNQTKNGSLRKSFGLNEGSKVIGTVASLREGKGHGYLLEAAKSIISSFPEVRFLIVGEGSERRRLEEKVSELGLLGKVIFTGGRKDVPEILSILDIFVLPSLNEGLPMALLEAMASRVPVVATRVGAVPKVVVHKETGLLVEPGNSEALSTAISELLTKREEATHLGLQGYFKVQNEFSAQTMSARYFDVYQQVLSNSDERS
jgi:glycosyltransferase involved in cell wall biosynthesis